MSDLREQRDDPQVVLQIVERTLGVDVESVDTDLLESGLLDSLGLIELVAELEVSFGVEIPIDTLELDDLRSPSSLSLIVAAGGARAVGSPSPPDHSSFPLPEGGEIRAMQRDRLPEVAALLLRTRFPTSEELDRFAALLGQYFFDQPHADPEIPSLVAVDSDDRVIGFMGSSVRRFDLNGVPVRMGCSGPLIVDPEASTPGVGVFLMERYLAGPQDFTITDGATDAVLDIWTKLGGRRADEVRDRWTAVLRPMMFANDRYLGSSRAGKAAALADRLLGPVSRRMLPRAPAIVSEPLSPDVLCTALDSLPDTIELRPAYDTDFLTWQLAIMGTVGQGAVRGALFRDPGGSIIGWYVYLLKPGGLAQVLQLAGETSALPQAFAHLLDDAYRGGATVVDGRVEPHMRAVLGHKAIKIRPSGSHPLRHTNEPALENVIFDSSAFISRFDGESWMGAFGQAARTDELAR